ncbi:MAG: hypothetical protein HEEMFOPI_01518 [Holosporales bacterium]
MFNKVLEMFEMSTSTRINLSVPLEIAIQIDKDCDKRGIIKTQFIKEAIYEKIKKTENKYLEDELKILSTEISDLKEIMRLILNLLESKKN